MAQHPSVPSAWGVLAAAALLVRVYVSASPPCVQLVSGRACGVWRSAWGHSYASFRGVPYARQPLGALRFQVHTSILAKYNDNVIKNTANTICCRMAGSYRKHAGDGHVQTMKELQPVEEWKETFQAIQEGPICPQKDVFYGRIMQPRNTTFTEACIYANVHVPRLSLPVPPHQRPKRGLQPPHRVAGDDKAAGNATGLPIFVFIHGGGFAFGSGDTDLHGPEYLVSQGIIVITFNYRLNVFGFLSLNNSFIPGNNGLRDMVTLLKWVQTNARAFGGNPHDVTLAGHSAGAASAHLLTLSKAATGLFRRAMLMSGTALPTFYTTTPAYAKLVSQMFLEGLGINDTDPEAVHRQLITTPLENIMQVHNAIQDQFGLGAFYPVVELSPFPNFTTILDDDPEALLVQGRGKDIPLIIGFTDAECYGFLPRFEQIDILARVNANPLVLTPMHLIYRRPVEVSLDIAKAVQTRYFDGEPTMDQYVKSCSEANFIYPAIKVALIRAAVGGEPVYLYEFSYQSEFSIKKEVDKANYKGAGHMEDLTYIFRVNSILGPDDTLMPKTSDADIQKCMVHFVKNFIKYSEPAGKEPHSLATPWPALTKRCKKYQGIDVPFCRTLELDNKHLEILRFFDSLQNRTS